VGFIIKQAKTIRIKNKRAGTYSTVKTGNNVNAPRYYTMVSTATGNLHTILKLKEENKCV